MEELKKQNQLLKNENRTFEMRVDQLEHVNKNLMMKNDSMRTRFGSAMALVPQYQNKIMELDAQLQQTKRELNESRNSSGRVVREQSRTQQQQQQHQQYFVKDDEDGTMNAHEDSSLDRLLRHHMEVYFGSCLVFLQYLFSLFFCLVFVIFLFCRPPPHPLPLCF
jgi:chromosome segregation ATPase